MNWQTKKHKVKVNIIFNRETIIEEVEVDIVFSEKYKHYGDRCLSRSFNQELVKQQLIELGYLNVRLKSISEIKRDGVIHRLPAQYTNILETKEVTSNNIHTESENKFLDHMDIMSAYFKIIL